MKKVGLLLLVLSLTMIIQRGVNAICISYDSAGLIVNYVFNSGDSLGIRGNKIEEEKISYSYYGVNFRKRIEKLSTENFNFFCGIEGNYIPSFRGENSKGSGLIIYSSLGGIVFFGKKIIFFSFEIGPGMICLEDEFTGERIIKWDPAVSNAGLGIRF